MISPTNAPQSFIRFFSISCLTIAIKRSNEIHAAKKLLVEALEARLDRKLKRIFRILGLKYPPNDIENAYSGIRSNDSELRINTVEFLDNLLDINLKKLIIPITESALFDEMVAKTLQRFGMKYEREDEYLLNILNSKPHS